MRNHGADRPTPVLLGAILGGIGGGMVFTAILAMHSAFHRPALAENPLHDRPFAVSGPGQLSDETYEEVSGTLRSLDLGSRKGMIVTDLGRQLTFIIVNPELFTHVSIGQRVTVKLDSKNRAIKVMETAAPELPSSTMPK